MKRSLSIVLAGALLCAAGAWLVTLGRVSSPPAGAATTPEAPSEAAEDAPPLEASAPEVHRRATRTDLTQLEPVALRFKGPRAILNLRVLDAARKDPVGDVAVSLSMAVSGTRGDAADQLTVGWMDLTRGDPPLTDGSGRVSLRVPAARSLRLDAEGKGLRTQRRTEEIPPLAPDEVRSIEIEVATEDDLHFFGQVFDGAKNAPIAGVAIQLERRPSIEPIAVSDARGRFELRTNSWESRRASATRRGFATVAFTVDDQHDSESRPQRLELTRAATVEGFYRDCDGKPAAEGSLRFWTSSGFAAHVYPREDGWFVADSLPTGETVKVDLELEHRPIVKEEASFVLAPSEVRRIDWKLPLRYPIHGIVLDELGTPVKGCGLELYFGSPTDPRCLEALRALDERELSLSDDEGRFTFRNAGPGSWVIALLRVRGRAAWARGPYSPPDLVAAQSLTLSGPEAGEVVLRYCRQTSIQGRVVDPEDHPVPGGRLRVQLVGCDASVERWVGKDGSFDVPVPGLDTFALSARGSGRYLDSDPITARGGERGVVLRLKRAPLLRVRVVDERTRQPVQAQVFGIGGPKASVNTLTYEETDEGGLLVHPCVSGTYRLFARSGDGRCGTLDEVVVDGDSSEREWTVAVAPAKNALVHSSRAGGLIEVYFSWNGIPIDQEEIASGSSHLISIPPGTLAARYRREEPVGDWQTLDTIIDDSRLVDIDLPFP